MTEYYPSYYPTSALPLTVYQELFLLDHVHVIRLSKDFDEKFDAWYKNLIKNTYYANDRKRYLDNPIWEQFFAYHSQSSWDNNKLLFKIKKGNADLLKSLNKKSGHTISPDLFTIAVVYGNPEICDFLDKMPRDNRFGSPRLLFPPYVFSQSPSVPWNDYIDQPIRPLSTIDGVSGKFYEANDSIVSQIYKCSDIVRSIFRQIPMSNVQFWSDCYYYRGPNKLLLTDVIDTWKYYAVICADEGVKVATLNENYCPPSNLLSVYNHFDTFQLMPIDSFEESCTMFRDTPRPTTGSSIVDSETFLKQFDAFTGGLFRNFKFNDRVAIVGGAISACLLPVSQEELVNKTLSEYYLEKYPSSDIDVFIYGVEETEDIFEIVKEIYRQVESVCKGDINMVSNNETVTIAAEYPFRHIQLVLSLNWDSLEHILYTTDIDCTGVAFTGTRVVCTPRARLSFVRRLTIPNAYHASIRGNRAYFHRLLKYVNRGFAIADPLLLQKKSEYDEMLNKVNIEELAPKFSNAFNLYKASTLLYMVHNLPALRKIAYEKEDPPIPFGPTWPAKKVFEELTVKGFKNEYPLSNYGYNTLAEYHIFSNKGDVEKYFDALESRLYSGFYAPFVTDKCPWE